MVPIDDDTRKFNADYIEKISEYDSENLMYSLIEEIIADNKYSSLDVVCHFPLNMLIKNPELLKPGESCYVTLMYTVEAPSNNTKVYTLINKAGIVSIINENGYKVNDADGLDNNYDMDWIQTSIYAVSLEKYVSNPDTSTR